MEVQTISYVGSQKVEDLLHQIDVDGAPLRIDNSTDTYYVLRADHLLALLKTDKSAATKAPQFTPADFGLSEEDITAYQARRQMRLAFVSHKRQRVLSSTLRKRLQHPTIDNLDSTEREHVLHELESAMLYNLEAAIK